MKQNTKSFGRLMVFSLMALSACAPSNSSSLSSGSEASSGAASSGTSTTTSSGTSENTSTPAVTSSELNQYVTTLKNNSKSNHLYYHYRRYTNNAASYAPYDVWAWNSAAGSEGHRFDWAGRTSPTDGVSAATGDATVDSIGGAYIDIDLTQSYSAGWDSASKTMGGHTLTFMTGGVLTTAVGLQIVLTASRNSGSGFWTNDGSDQKPVLADYAWQNTDGTTSYHIFCVQDKVAERSKDPIVSLKDPYSDDDGTNVTYGNSKYNDVDWTNKAIKDTSPMFLKGTNGGATVTANSNQGDLTDGAGVGYQIMVASFADSDGDGFGDIYGIDQKLDYLKDLGVNVLWLTPIQLSDSYHGYDITDYTQVDPKFGSTKSPAGKTAGKVTCDTAMQDYKQLLSDAHAKHMLVMMDLVLNHTSTGNVWFTKSAQLDTTYRGYYQWGNNQTQSSTIKTENYWYPYGDHVYSYYAKFGSSMPEINYSYEASRIAVAEMAKDWCSIGVDGFRMDAVKHIFLKDEVTAETTDTIVDDGTYSSNLTKNINFWRQLAYDVKTAYPNAMFVGENYSGHAYQVAPYYEGLDSLFDFYSYFQLTSAAANYLGAGTSQTIFSYDGKDGGSQYTNDTSGGSGSIKYLASSKWDVSDAFKTYNRYRTGVDSDPSTDTGMSFINGAFTSNHDTARTINRVAGTEHDGNGLTAQGTITTSNYDKYLKSATCVQLAELMLPGCTWIYYGDELGMTGNFASGISKSTDSYADLAYRQPMKWVDDAAAGSDFTCGYSITGSGQTVAWDDVNKTTTVPSAANASSNAHFKAIKDFANLKSTTPALIRGTFTANGWDYNGSAAPYVFNVVRQLGTVKYDIVINFSTDVTLNAGFTNLVASYNGATASSIPPQSAAVYLL